MLHTTEGIVLRTLRHQDSNLIVRLYTQKFGIQDFMLKSYGSAQGRKKYSNFQNMSILEIVYNEKSGSSLHSIQESRASVFLQHVQTEAIHLSLGLTIIEIFTNCVQLDEADEEIYDLLKSVILALDKHTDKLIPIFLFFLAKFTAVMGFAPSWNVQDEKQPIYWDIVSGVMQNGEKGHTRICQLVQAFLHSDVESCRTIFFTQAEKRAYITTLFQYYYYHIQGFKYPKTLQVFAEIFG